MGENQNTEVKNTEEVKNPTVIDVSMPEKDSSDLENNEIVEVVPPETKPVESAELTKDQIKQEQKDYMLKLAKESNIDWDKIEFEEDGVTPKVTEETCKIFNAAVSDYFDVNSLDTYIHMAKDAIEDYKRTKEAVDKGEADKDDLEYFKSCTVGYEDSRLVLAMIQQESKRLEKEFAESMVAEKFIKAVTLKSLRDYIVDEYRLTDSWYNPENKPIKELDKTKEIDESLIKKMYVTPMFAEQIKRYFVKYLSSQEYNIFGYEFIERSEDRFVLGLQNYISHIQSKENIDISLLIKRDFQSLDFFTTIIRYALIVNKDPTIEKVEDKELNILKEKLDNNGVITSQSGNIFEQIYKIIDEIINDLKRSDNLERIKYITKDIFEKDPLYKDFNPRNDINIDDYSKTIVEISKAFPTVEALQLKKWGKHYAFMNKYENYITYSKLQAVIDDETKTEVEKRSACINTIVSIVHSMYMFIFSEIIINLTHFIKFNLNTKETRDTIFATMFNNLILQHQLGYKVTFTEENSKGDALYKLCEEALGKNQYDMFIGDKKDDIILKEVDLSVVRSSYFEVVQDMLSLVQSNLASIFNDSYISWRNKKLANEQVQLANKKKNKKKHHKR